MLISELEGLDIAILGAGREGRSARRWLRRHFPELPVTVYDENPSGDGFGPMQDEPLTTTVAGPLDPGRLAAHDLLVRSPGISPYRPELTRLREQGKRFTSASSLWFANHPAAKTICITGTKGKSTTAALTVHLLRAAGLAAELAGNIGRPLLDCDDTDPDWWVIELSSYQLADLQASPTIAAILNLSDEHLDWHGSREIYRRDKLRIAGLSPDAPLVANAADSELPEALAGRRNVRWFGSAEGCHVAGDRLLRGHEPLRGLPRDSLPGPHNLANLAAALTILEVAGIEMRDVGVKLKNFNGLPHRLQFLGEVEGVRFVNDSLSTTPVATLAALRALAGRRVILLLGGTDRGLDWGPAAREMADTPPHAVICMPGNGPAIAAALANAGLSPPGGIQCAADLREAMDIAHRLARRGDTVLLSPGAPSFPQFRDYAARGERFAALAGIRRPKTEETAGVG